MTVSVVMLRSVRGEDGSQWRTGLTYPASVGYARALVEDGAAYVESGVQSGFIGQITADNFGVNSIRYPLNWDGITDGVPTRAGVDGPLKAAVQPGNWVRVFFGFDGNGKGGAGTGPATGLFQAAPPVPGDAKFSGYAGYQANGAASSSATTVALDTGTGAITAGATIVFASHATVYTITVGTTGPGTITITPALTHAVADNEVATLYDGRRLLDLIYILDSCHAAGLRVLLALEGNVPTTDANMKLYRDRLDTLLRALGQATDRQATFIDAFEPSNEVFQQSGVTVARVAEMMRITFKLFRAYSPRTKVLSASYQGGEAMGGNLVLQLMAASAAGINAAPYDVVGYLNDGGGAGSTGEQFFDAVAFHPYIETVGTIASATAALASSSAQSRMKEFLDPIRTAFATRRAANPTYWNGRLDPEIWATEYNVNPNGGLAQTNSAFRMQYYSPEERAQFIEQMVHAAFACGCSKVMPYAVDHHFTQGPIGELTKSAAPNGDLRVNTVAAGSTPILDNDRLFVSDSVGWCYAYNASEDGLTCDFKNVSTAEYYPYQATAHRWQLGGWADGYLAIQSRLMGYAEFGWYPTGDISTPYVPQYRTNRQLIRTVAGRATAVSAVSEHT